MLDVVHPQPFVPELEGVRPRDLGEVLIELVSVVHIDAHGANAELGAAVWTFGHPEVNRIEIHVGGEVGNGLGHLERVVLPAERLVVVGPPV